MSLVHSRLPCILRELQRLHGNDLERDLIFPAERFHKLCVPVRLSAADPVMYVHYPVLCPENPSELDQDMQKCGGIRASADADDDSVSLADHVGARNILPHLILNLYHG